MKRRQQHSASLWIENNQLGISLHGPAALVLLEGNKHPTKPDCWLAPLSTETIRQLKAIHPERFTITPEVYHWYRQTRCSERQAHYTQLVNIAKINPKLFPYQRYGAAFLASRLNSLLLDDMGLGKTVQTITAIETDGHYFRALIVCPGILKTNWENEIALWTKTSATVVEGTAATRNQIITAFDHGYLIIGIETLRLHPELQALRWDWLVVDESHRIRNPQAQQTKAVRRLPAVRKVLLTGSPIINRIDDLWSLLNVVDPHRFSNQAGFVRYYTQEDIFAPIRQRQLETVLREYSLRRTKEQVLPELPPKIYQQLPVEMTPQQAHIYKTFRGEARKGWQQKSYTPLDVFVLITRLRQLAASPQLLHYDETGAKFEAIKDMIENNTSTRFVVFSNFAEAAHRLQPLIGPRAVILTGAVPQTHRAEVLDHFAKTADAVLIATYQLAGIGLNLTAAYNIILLDKPWSPAILNQAIDRCHRIGQQHPVHIVDLVLQASIDERVNQILYTKETLIEPLLAAVQIAASDGLIDQEEMEGSKWFKKIVPIPA